MSAKLVSLILLIASPWGALGAAAAELPRGAKVLDADLLWDVTDPDTAVISPEGKQIAYISRGAIWRCSVTEGPPLKLADLPQTMTAYLMEPRFQAALNNANNLAMVLKRSDFEELHRRARVFGLRWTPSQDGVIYGLRSSWTKDARSRTDRILHASLTGVVTEITEIGGDLGGEPGRFDDFHVTADRKFVIATGNNPLIWNVAKRGPQVTPYDFLLPSSTSGRFLAIEIDTRQLVLVDENFQVAERFDVHFASDRPSDIAWSPDERFALCRQSREHPYDKWMGFRLDLHSGEKRAFRGYYWDVDRCVFTGRGGEFILFGVRGFLSEHVDRMVGAQLWLFPSGDDQARKLVRYDEPENLTGFVKSAGRHGFPPVVANPDGSLFAMPLPRPPESRPGYLYHFIDRDGTARPWTPYHPREYLAPAQVLAFANEGQTIVARTSDQLLSVPLSEILRPEKTAQ